MNRRDALIVGGGVITGSFAGLGLIKMAHLLFDKAHTEDIAGSFMRTGQKLTEYDPQAMADYFIWLYQQKPEQYGEDMLDLLFKSMVYSVAAFGDEVLAKQWSRAYADLQLRLREG